MNDDPPKSKLLEITEVTLKIAEWFYPGWESDPQWDRVIGTGPYTLADVRDEIAALLTTRPTSAGQSEEVVERVAKALAKADGLDFDEVCGCETEADECDSGTCVAAHLEDHDAEWARSWYIRHAHAALSALDLPAVQRDARREEVVERVARAICTAEGFEPDRRNARGVINWVSYKPAAIRALSALDLPTIQRDARREAEIEKLLVLIETAHEHGDECAIVEQAETIRALKEGTGE